MNRYFQLGLTGSILDEIYSLHESKKEKAWNYNKGLVSRWREEMNASDIRVCDELLAQEIERMGFG